MASVQLLSYNSENLSLILLGLLLSPKLANAGLLTSSRIPACSDNLYLGHTFSSRFYLSIHALWFFLLPTNFEGNR